MKIYRKGLINWAFALGVMLIVATPVCAQSDIELGSDENKSEIVVLDENTDEDKELESSIDIVEPEEEALSDKDDEVIETEDDEPVDDTIESNLEGWVGEYYYENGKKVSGEKKIDGKWYYFDPKNDSAKATGWVDLEEKRVFYSEDGTIVYGKKEINGAIYYFHPITGAMITGEAKVDGKWCYFDTDGKMVTGWVNLETKRVYYSKDGTMTYGKQKLDGAIYYFHPITGAMIIGEAKVDGNWCYFDTDGKMVTGWVDLETKRVYYGTDGVMCYGEQKIDGKWYNFHSVTGAMSTGFVKLSGKTVYYGTDGAMRYGEQKINGKWYYFNTVTGAMATGFVKLPTPKTVYYGSDGVMRYGEQKINGKWYYFNTVTGAMATGFVKLPGKTVYYGSDGTMRYGEQTINGKIYYFNTTTGAMIDNAGWVKVNGTWCYFDKNTGKQLFKSNILHTAWNKAQSMSSSSKYIIIVDRANCRTMIFTGSKGNWVPLYDWACSPGKSSTPTISGTYTVGIKGYSFGTSNYTCYYYTQIKGNYLFHSILYKAGTFNVKDGRLGQHLSHGCVRLSLANAKWMYNNIPRSTKIYIY